MGYETKDSGVRESFDSGMVRDTQNDKPRYDLVYIPLLTRWAELMARGAIKYGERNWEKAKGAIELARFKASAFRHFMQWFNGERDEDHAAAVLFNIAGAEYVTDKLVETAKQYQSPCDGAILGIAAGPIKAGDVCTLDNKGLLTTKEFQRAANIEADVEEVTRVWRQNDPLNHVDILLFEHTSGYTWVTFEDGGWKAYFTKNTCEKWIEGVEGVELLYDASDPVPPTYPCLAEIVTRSNEFHEFRKGSVVVVTERDKHNGWRRAYHTRKMDFDGEPEWYFVEEKDYERLTD